MQPFLVTVRQLEVICDDLTVRDQDVIDTALALFANRQGTVGFALNEG